MRLNHVAFHWLLLDLLIVCVQGEASDQLLGSRASPVRRRRAGTSQAAAGQVSVGDKAKLLVSECY